MTASNDVVLRWMLLLLAVPSAHGLTMPMRTLSVRRLSTQSLPDGRWITLRASTAAAAGSFGESSPVENRLTSAHDAIQSGVNNTAAAAAAAVAIPPVASLSKKVEKVPFPIVLWRFTRPHTLIGSALAIPALHCLAAPSLSQMISLPVAASLVASMVPSLLMNLYITGLNQITDVEIDRINKPNLPIAAGILSRRAALVVVVVSLVASLTMGPMLYPQLSTAGLSFALWGSAILGTLYSLEPFRLKRFPLLAAFCIVAVRGTVINAGFFAHATAAAFGGASSIHHALADPKCLLSSAFFCVFGMVIALMKDVPDVIGDRKSNVRTLSVRLGQKRIFHAARQLLTGLFVGVGIGFAQGALRAPSTALTLGRTIMAGAGLAAGWSVRQESQPVDPENPAQVYNFYMHLWKLFYLSYLVLPLAR